MSNQIGPTIYQPEPVKVCNGCKYCHTPQVMEIEWFLCRHPAMFHLGTHQCELSIDDKILTPPWCPVMKESEKE
jgi:hypothetical protein